MKTIHNPILPGFHPDPSFVRVGADYYLVTSSFEWFPGIPIHHSLDLVHWRLIGHVLTEKRLLDLRGISDSGGVWAPSLSWFDDTFFLVYTNVRTCGMGRPFKDTPFCLITAKSITGPWSNPVHLGSAGFDPFLFHDDDGRKWVVNMAWDFRKNHPRFAGITLQEYDHQKGRMVGPVHQLLRKKELIEGPNLYKRNGIYYLMLAEGGTGWNHGISMARASSIVGPYEVDPQPSVLTSRGDKTLKLQKAGHGELVETGEGDWMLAHLCSRPIDVGGERRCMLGRETALQPVEWTADGWLRLKSGEVTPELEVAAPAGLDEVIWPALPSRDDFDEATLELSWNSLRTPVDESWLSLRERPGWLRLHGRESVLSLFEQSLIAKRLVAFHVLVQTRLEFHPETFNHMAGLICWYDTKTHYYLRVTHDETVGKVLGIVLMDDGRYDELVESQIRIGDWEACHLQAEIDHENLQFSASPDGVNWRTVGPVLDASKLSDDYGANVLHFTGSFVGLCAQDLGGTNRVADFDYFEVQVR